MTTLDATPTRTSNRARWIVLIVFVIMAVLVYVLATRPAANTESIASPLVGQPAPQITGTSLGGTNVDLASLKGRYVVVNFFATWCGPCIQENPEIKKFAAENTGTNAPVVLAVAFKDADSNVKDFFAKNNNTWPVVADPDGKISVEYGIRGLPESYIVDPNGNISAHVTGGISQSGLVHLTDPSA